VTAARALVVVLALSAVAVYLGLYRERQQDEAALARIASVIAGRGVTVECAGAFATLTDVSSRDGSVEFGPDGTPADEAKLSGATCARLRSFLAGGVPGLDCLAVVGHCSEVAERAAVAVNVLSHEAWHLRGVRNEAAAQCYALQTNADTALQLGASPDEAVAIASWVDRRVQPALPSDYRTSECHDGGPLDLHPERTGWP
jgi:preprotein translocase subunit YajC